MSLLGCMVCAGYLYMGVGYDNDSDWLNRQTPIYSTVEAGYSIMKINKFNLINRIVVKSDPSADEKSEASSFELGIRIDF